MQTEFEFTFVTSQGEYDSECVTAHTETDAERMLREQCDVARILYVDEL